MNKEIYDLKVSYIVQNFDFYKVAKIMEILNWKYAESDMTPTVEELRIVVDELFSTLYEEHKKAGSVSTGGFKVSMDDNDLSLEFIIEEQVA